MRGQERFQRQRFYIAMGTLSKLATEHASSIAQGLLRRELLLVLCILAVSLVAALPFLGYMGVDGFLYLHYANNLVRGEGLVFNQGEPNLMLTGPLWALALAGGGVLVGTTPLMASALAVAVSGASVIVLYFGARRLMLGTKLAVLVAAFWSVDAYRLRHVSWGTEVSLATFLILFGIYVHLRERGKSPPVFSSAIFAMAALSRPEAVLLQFLSVVDILWNTSPSRAKLRSTVISLLSFCIVLLAWVLLAYANYGSLAKAIPSNLSMKLATTLDRPGSALVLALGLATGYAVEIALMGAAVWVFLTKQRDRVDMASAKLRCHVVPLGWMVGLPLGYLLLGVQPGLAYLQLVAPFLIVYGVLGFRYIVERPQEETQRGPTKLLRLFSSLCLLFAVFVLVAGIFNVSAEFWVWQSSPRLWERIRNPNLYVPVAMGVLGFLSLRWLAAHHSVRLQRITKMMRGRSLAVVALSLLVLAQHIFLLAYVFYPYQRYERTNFVRPLLELGEWFRGNTSESAIIATEDYPSAVMVAYVSGRKVFNKSGPILSPAAGKEADYYVMVRSEVAYKGDGSLSSSVQPLYTEPVRFLRSGELFRRTANIAYYEVLSPPAKR